MAPLPFRYRFSYGAHTPLIRDFHRLPPDTSPAWVPHQKKLYKTCSAANDGPWRQVQGALVQLQDGLD